MVKEENKLRGALENNKNVVIFSYLNTINMVKKILIGLLLLIVVMQLLQPTKNVAEGISENDITKAYSVPTEVHEVLTKKCYDCHSHNTHYPWYVYVQPIGWWMASHIKEGKEHLNFSEFKTYSEKKSLNKLEELSEAVTDGWMPLESYVWLHQDAKVTSDETKAINDWIKSLGAETKDTEQ